MNDREIALSSVLATVLWTLGIVLVAAGIVTEHIGIPTLGLVAVVAGAVLNVRGFFSHFYSRMADAFQLGRDYERGRARDDHAEVRSIR